MNRIAEEILSYYGISELSENDILRHYGMPRRSGRYPWGSGENPYQHSADFLARVEELQKQGKTEKEIADEIGLTTTELRVQKSLAKDERRGLEVATAKALKEKGYGVNEIARRMGRNESSVRSLLNEHSEARMNQARKTADILKKEVDEKGMIDVGAGIERKLGISREKLNEALYILEREGYPNFGGGVAQVTNSGKQTVLKVLCPPGSEHKDIYNFENINQIEGVISYDGGDSYHKSFEYPSSMDSKRLQIRYAEEGGKEMDGVIELRRGCKDLDLGDSHYAQVRIMVDNDRYLKGMAVYSDDLPDGIDVRFNTNKTTGTPMRDVLKKIKEDPNNPFGSLIKEEGGQSFYDDSNGKYTNPTTGQKQSLSLINKRATEGDWRDWDDRLPSQFLAKQSQQLIDKQLGLTIADKRSELDDILSLTNPTVKKRLLQSYADDCDAAAVHLKAAALPRQKYQVILPVKSMKDNEVYAPYLENGETVALVRFPHAGTFEIPILKVNNKNPDAIAMLGKTPKDAVGINSKVAEQLSGADFDGDTVMVIPCNSSKSSVRITSSRPLDGLKDFDPKMTYPERKGMKYMTNTQTEMGKISNLITDMTLKGATDDELERAVRHSMVVIDAEKHKLDYKMSELDNGIASLKKKYQGEVDENGRYHEGASTLLSRAKSETSVLKRRGTPKVNMSDKPWYDPTKPEGSLLYNIHQNKKGMPGYDPSKPDGAWVKSAPETYIDKKGKTQVRTQQSTKMMETDDAYTLVSDMNSPRERAYANFANQMKAFANTARKEMMTAGKIEYSAQAKATYQKEVTSLKAKLNLALENAPRERQAQIMANAAINSIISTYKKDHPGMTKEEEKEFKKLLKKTKNQVLMDCRRKVGSKRQPVDITQREWEAIQAGAISENVLTQILNNTDIDKVKELATPRTKTTPSDAKINRIAALKRSGYTIDEISKAVGLSTSTVVKYMK